VPDNVSFENYYRLMELVRECGGVRVNDGSSSLLAWPATALAAYD